MTRYGNWLGTLSAECKTNNMSSWTQLSCKIYLWTIMSFAVADWSVLVIDLILHYPAITTDWPVNVCKIIRC